jgi:hypothetical protein
MVKWIKSGVDWFCAYITIQQFFVGSTVIGAATIGAWAASATEWINQYGPIAWVATAFICAGLTVFIFWGASKIKLNWETASATKKWKQDVTNINPLDNEFNRKRINFKDLVHPIHRKIIGKTFTHCELMGPANIILENCMLNGVVFHDCDIVITKEGASVKIVNMVILQRCNFVGGEIFTCTIFAEPEARAAFEAMGADIVT